MVVRVCVLVVDANVPDSEQERRIRMHVLAVDESESGACVWL
jgi:hypothetical protein